MLTMEKIIFLKSVPLFAGLKMNELAYIASIASELKACKNDALFSEDEMGDCLYLIITGQVKIVKNHSDHERILSILGERECVGEMSILDNEPRSASVILTEDSTFLKITSDDFSELIHEYPEIAFGVFKVFTRRLREHQVENDAPGMTPSISLQ